MLLILVNVLVLAVIYIFLVRRINRLTDTEKLTKSLTVELDLVLSEINQATERNILVIEDKINQLEDIIKTAEKRITLLKKSVPPENSPLPEKVLKKSPPAPKSIYPEQFELASEESESGELTYSHLNRMNKLAKVVAPLSVQDKNEESSNHVKKRIIELHKNGIDSKIIASNVRVNLGEVELIISLYNQLSEQEYNG